jgi:hypothetical protein
MTKEVNLGMPNSETARGVTTRLYRLWCWLWWGHDGVPEGRSVRICGRCGAAQLGGD